MSSSCATKNLTAANTMNHKFRVNSPSVAPSPAHPAFSSNAAQVPVIFARFSHLPILPPLQQNLLTMEQIVTVDETQIKDKKCILLRIKGGKQFVLQCEVAEDFMVFSIFLPCAVKRIPMSLSSSYASTPCLSRVTPSLCSGRRS